MTSRCRPRQGIVIVFQSRTETDFDQCADRKPDRLVGDNRGGTVTLGTQCNFTIAGRDDQRTGRNEHNARDGAQTIAKCAAGGQPPKFCRAHGAANAEQLRIGVPSIPLPSS